MTDLTTSEAAKLYRQMTDRKLSDLTPERVRQALDKWDDAIEDAGVWTDKDRYEFVYAELTRVEPEYVFSEQLATNFWRLYHGALHESFKPTPELRAALDAIARDVATELAERANVESHWNGVRIQIGSDHVWPRPSEVINAICRGLPEGDKP